jgi:hypothetical protein
VFLIEAARNLAELGRELLDAAAVALTPRAIDTATASPLHGHDVEHHTDGLHA